MRQTEQLSIVKKRHFVIQVNKSREKQVAHMQIKNISLKIENPPKTRQTISWLNRICRAIQDGIIH